MVRARIVPASELKKKDEITKSEIIARLSRLENIMLQILDRLETLQERMEKQEPKHYGRQNRKGVRIIVKGSKKKEGKKSALDIMREQGVLFESDLRSINNKNKFFSYLQKNGIIVIEGIRERVAVTEEFLEKFMDEIGKYRNPGEAEEKLKNEKMKRIYLFLRESGYLTFDSKNGWSLNLE